MKSHKLSVFVKVLEKKYRVVPPSPLLHLVFMICLHAYGSCIHVKWELFVEVLFGKVNYPKKLVSFRSLIKHFENLVLCEYLSPSFIH